VTVVTKSRFIETTGALNATPAEPTDLRTNAIVVPALAARLYSADDQFSRGEVTGSFSLRRLCRGPAALSKRIGTSTARNANPEALASTKLIEA
jgi:hypothetical protein